MEHVDQSITGEESMKALTNEFIPLGRVRFLHLDPRNPPPRRLTGMVSAAQPHNECRSHIRRVFVLWFS